jgi:DNA-binding NarL/FixJ family response regulator
MLVDDHDMVRRGVRGLLESQDDLAVVAEAASADEALQLARETCPGIAVVDLMLPDGSGLDLTLELKRQHPTLKVLILTLHEREEMVQAAIEVGADAFLFKSDDEDELLSAIGALAVGRTYFPGLFSPEIVAKIRSGTLDAASVKRLTGREREVVAEISRGRTGKEIAKILSISPKTVETHRSNAREKLNAVGTADLVRYAVRNGLVEV